MIASQPDNEAIFHAARDIPDSDHRREYVRQACGGDEARIAHVEALLLAAEGPDSLLDRPAGTPVATIDLPTTERPGTVIGPYKLLEKIGEGGFGVVFMAEQQEPIRRKVALKVLKPGMDSKQVIARFEVERQALALMDHPHIAKVLDAGQTDSGRPYFVMDLVKGLPITEFCDQSRLSPRERLGLFVSVCQAVQHAHQKGIIHRDIKPTNVLVTLHDGTPLVKVIDFGIAKALGQQLTDLTLFTGFAQMIGTPLYMAPEQAALSNVDVDTRSDIYSLGVLLYELLTGTTPFDKERLRQVGFDEMRRIIREEEPPKPSTRISTLGQAATTASTQRKSDPKRLSQLFRGELDWIVMKALEKDRNRRYETASAFAADVQRYLADEPVQACPPSRTYRLKKFLRRNKGPVLAVALVLLALVGGIVGTTLGLVRALDAEQDANSQRLLVEQERDAKAKALAEAVASEKQAWANRQRTRDSLETMTDDVIEKLLGKQGKLGKREEAFLRKVERFYEDLAQSQGDAVPARFDRAIGRHRVGAIRHRLGQLKEAEASCRDSLALSRQLVADFPTMPAARQNLMAILISLADLLRQTGRPKEAEAGYREALTLSRRLAEEFPANAQHREHQAQWHTHLGPLLVETHRVKEAEKVLRDGLVLYRQLIADFGGEANYRQGMAASLGNLGLLLLEADRPKEAEAAYRDALAIQQGLVREFPDVPEYRQDLAGTHSNLGEPLVKMGRPKEAETAYRNALAVRQKLADDYPTVAVYRHDLAAGYHNLGVVLANTGRPQDAEAAHGKALVISQKLADDFPSVPDYASTLAATMGSLATLNNDAKNYAAARKLLERARPYNRRALTANPKNPIYLSSFSFNRGAMCAALVGLGEHTAAAAEAQELARVGFDPAEDCYNAACYMSRCVPLAGKDASLLQAERKELARRYSDRAMDFLRQAVKAGWKDARHIRKDTDLDPLRGREDFRKLVEELDKKAKRN
jgi:serine/threonine protein kinase/tetratricopeptide (TPR) repeat protein